MNATPKSERVDMWATSHEVEELEYLRLIRKDERRKRRLANKEKREQSFFLGRKKPIFVSFSVHWNGKTRSYDSEERGISFSTIGAAKEHALAKFKKILKSRGRQALAVSEKWAIETSMADEFDSSSRFLKVSFIPKAERTRKDGEALFFNMQSLSVGLNAPIDREKPYPHPEEGK